MPCHDHHKDDASHVYLHDVEGLMSGIDYSFQVAAVGRIEESIVLKAAAHTCMVNPPTTTVEQGTICEVIDPFAAVNSRRTSRISFLGEVARPASSSPEWLACEALYVTIALMVVGVQLIEIEFRHPGPLQQEHRFPNLFGVR